MSFLAKQGGSIFFETKGSGHPLVLLRGLGRSSRHWLGWDEELSNKYNVITIDARGVGRSSMPMLVKDTVFDLASDVADVLRELSIDSAHVLGVSLGGMVAMAVGLDHPERVKSLVIINSSTGGSLLPRISPFALKALLKAGNLSNPRRNEPLSRALLSGEVSPERREEIIKEWEEIELAEGLPKETVTNQLGAAIRFSSKRKLSKMRIPALVICGSKDKFVPIWNSKRLVKLLPEARLKIIEGGGHELTLDKGDEVSRELEDWIC